MSRAQTYEQIQLYEVEKIISANTNNYSERMLLLEAFAASVSGTKIEEFWNSFGIEVYEYTVNYDIISQIKSKIDLTDITYSMAISSLIREPLTIEEQKKNGAFYTDFRLAKFIANKRKADIKIDSTVVDFAAGTGILLVGIAEKYKEKFPENFDDWMRDCVYAFDLSENALRGVTAAMLALSSNLSALVEMASKWKVCDSLLDKEVENIKFDLVVGNPPWGKIKVTRHSFALRQGENRIYGSDYSDLDYEKYEEERDGLAQYSKDIKRKFDLLGSAEPDMYMAFLQKAILATKIAGKISLLVPAGLIRSQGTKSIREFLIKNSHKLEYDLFDNKGNFFSIDSRFKFLLVSIENGGKREIEDVDFRINTIENQTIVEGETIKFNSKLLKRIRPDLTIPEVKTEKEKDIFTHIIENGIAWGMTDDVWKADISREVDMTNDRKHFSMKAGPGEIPVIEGRMVQQHRFGVKTYISGSGRSAVWKPCAKDGKTQFFIKKDILNVDLINRSNKMRAGYCDIAGQTNERAMMSAIIPPGVICGNKVPTILFPNAEEDILFLWIGITNSFVFDWMIRRIISTTVNYFLLFSVPMPNINIDSEIAIKIIEDTKKLSLMGMEYYQGSEMQHLRSEIDILVAKAYGLGFEEVEIILRDFPIMDRKQPSIENEKKSTITRDLILSQAELVFEKNSNKYINRYELGRANYAKAYIPSEMIILGEGGI